MKKRMFMALAVALTGVSMVVAAGNGELKIQSEASVQKVHAAEIHQIGVEPIPATGQITIEDLLAVQGGETEDPRALEGVSDPEDVPVDEASVEDTTADEYASLAIANVTLAGDLLHDRTVHKVVQVVVVLAHVEEAVFLQTPGLMHLKIKTDGFHAGCYFNCFLFSSITASYTDLIFAAASFHLRLVTSSRPFEANMPDRAGYLISP